MIGKYTPLPPPATWTEWTKPKDVAPNPVERGGMDLGEMSLKIDERKGAFSATRTEVLVHPVLGNDLWVDPDGFSGMLLAYVLVSFFLGWEGQKAVGAGQLIRPETVETPSVALDGRLGEQLETSLALNDARCDREHPLSTDGKVVKIGNSLRLGGRCWRY